MKRIAIVAVMAVLATLLLVVPTSAGQTSTIVHDIEVDGAPYNEDLWMSHVNTAWCGVDYKHKVRYYTKLNSAYGPAYAGVRNPEITVHYADGFVANKSNSNIFRIDQGTGYTRMITYTTPHTNPGKVTYIEGDSYLGGAGYAPQLSWVLKQRIKDFCVYSPGGPS